MTDLQRAERSIKMRGVAEYQGVHVKIVPNGDGFGVETTVAGDRRYPVENPMPLVEAQALALCQLVSPRDAVSYVPQTVPALSVPKSRMPYMAPGDLISQYKRQGLDKHAAWKSFIVDTILQPRFRSESLDANDFFNYFDEL